MWYIFSGSISRISASPDNFLTSYSSSPDSIISSKPYPSKFLAVFSYTVSPTIVLIIHHFRFSRPTVLPSQELSPKSRCELFYLGSELWCDEHLVIMNHLYGD
jgi:hypothetical protein